MNGQKEKIEQQQRIIANLEVDIDRKRLMYEDQHAKAHYSIRERDILKEKVQFYEQNFAELEKFFRKSVNQYNSERRKLTERINAMVKTSTKKKGLLKIASEYRASEIFYSSNNEYNIDQLLLRFNTVSPESSKFLELLNLIRDFYQIVQLELAEL